MSDQLTGALFDSEVFTHPSWWIGRVESKETWSDNIAGETFTNAAEIKGWGQRYKVRVFNWHTGDVDKVKPDQIPYMQVVMPVTAGSGHGGASITPAIESGSVVFGFFMDGMAGQEGYIVGILGNSNNNVPKERLEPAPNQPQTSVTPVPAGSPPGTPPTVTTTPPPTPPTGPGSLETQPVPPNVDQLSVDQLKKLLDPSKTPSSAVFKAASEARQKAKAAGLPANEVERLVLAATVKASRQPGADAGGSANCNKGYQQFNNTYTDGSPQRAAKVPDNLIVGGMPLSITEGLHQYTQAWTFQDKSKSIKIPLLDVSKENNSDMKAIQRTMKNLINGVEELKKTYNQVSAFATDVSEFSSQIQNQISGAVSEMSAYTKNIMGGVRGYILTKLSDEVKKAAPNLFPTQIPKLYEKVEEGTSLLNCAFNKITSNMPGLLEGLLNNVLDKIVNAPLCAIENFVGGILDNVLGQLMGVLDQVFAGINSVIGTALGVIGQIGGVLDTVSGALGALGGIGGIGGGGNLFNALEYVNGIKSFFKCDDPATPVKYNEVAYGYPALPGGDAAPTPTAENESPTGQGAGGSSTVSASISSKTTPLEGEEIINAVNANNAPIGGSATQTNLREELGTDFTFTLA